MRSVRIGSRGTSLGLDCVRSAVLARVAERSVARAGGVVAGTGDGLAIGFLSGLLGGSALSVALSHANIAANANSAALVSNNFAESGALHQARKLLGTKDVEGNRLDFHAPVNTGWHISGGFEVKVLFFLGCLKQAERETEVAFVADREIGKDEVASLVWSVEIGHAGGGNTCENGRVEGGGRLDTAVCHGTGLLETGIEEEVGVVVKGDILAFFDGRAFDNAKLNDRRRIHGTTVAVGLHASTACSGAFGLLENF